MNRNYASPAAFKQALEQRLRASTGSGPELARRRQLLVFERYLARLVKVWGNNAVLKGGLVLEIRLQRARTTKDIDLRLVGSTADVLGDLQRAGRQDLDDFLSFEVRADDNHPTMLSDGMKYEGQRFRAECRLASKLYGQPFGVDVGIGDPIFGAPSLTTLDDSLAFAGIPPTTLQLYPVLTHIAEKLHAYTMPRTRPNSRIKDLPDLALLAMTGPLSGDDLRAAFEQTFSFRNTHEIPGALPGPLATWEKPYSTMASSNQLRWTGLHELTLAVGAFLDPILSGRRDLYWNPESWQWS